MEISRTLFWKPAFSTNATGGTEVTAHLASKAELHLAGDAVSVLKAIPVYARVGLVPNEYGVVVMEMELIEPDLGLRLFPTAADRMAMACFQIGFSK